MIFLMRTFKSFGGRSDTGQFSNTYHIRSDAAIDAAGWADVVNTVIAVERPLALTSTSFMRALITPFAENPLNQPEHVMRTIELQGTGAREIPAGFHGLDLNVALILKRQLATGRSGRMFLRGGLHEQDVELGSNGRFRLSPTSSLAQPAQVGVVAGMMNLPAAFKHVIPNPAGLIVQTSRDVTAFTMGGVTLNRRDHRKTKKGGVINAAQKLIDAIATAALKLAPTAAAGALLQGASALAFTALRGQAAAFLATLSAAEVAELALPLILL